ncbi:hypothetical protein CY0110_18522 [Crocosphaera chwakensis CCY0110]|uniref:Uncharacterized protein n=1 Tax=Crocosphaera chwakensis CCY0110 TaxID=391612 RepID=A3IJ36_9CHRO|nr:hypothetical protein CY0110_18522 [Crocosphaera chwakensis CCY0110]
MPTLQYFVIVSKFDLLSLAYDQRNCNQ